MRVLLVAPPYRPPNEGALALATLRPILERAGHEVHELHGSLEFPTNAGLLPPAWFHWNATHAFGRALRGCSVEEHVERVLASTRADLDPKAVVAPHDRLWSAYDVDEQAMRADIRAKIAAADICIERMVERVAGEPFDVVGISTMFTDQIAAGIVVARHLKQRWPDVKIVFGGAVCLEEQGLGLLATFPEVDAACVTEGEDVIAPLVEALGGQRRLSEVPGVVWRDGSDLRRNPSPPLQENLDRLPIPDYDAFVAALAESEWASEGADLFFETSRGCWWGVKSLCTFCGLNGDGLSYRSKSPQRAVTEIRSLYERYPGAVYLRAADNILDLRYIREALPHLHDLASARPRPLRMYYEVKSNMRADQIEQLVAGGIRRVQPGIESFSDGVLELMRKGNTALGQVQFVKWAAEVGLQMDYNVLVLNPGEQASWYREMLELVPFLEHLPPPNGNATVVLERFSPYFNNPEAFGIKNVRPQQSFFDFFGSDADPRLAYKFDYDHAMHDDVEHLDAVRALVAAVRRWRDRWTPDRAFYLDTGDEIAIIDRRGGAERRTILAGPPARLFRMLDRNRSRSSLARETSDLDPSCIDLVLDTWLHRRWICQIGERYLAVLPRKGQRPATAKARPRAHLAVVTA